jgi:xylan 1,4-beta-xylosidase
LAAQLKRAHDELGMRHVRFNGILCDHMGTLIAQCDEFIYSFFNSDQIFEYLLSYGMTPFDELSFIPLCLSSSDQRQLHYRANVSPPKDLAQWSVLIQKIVSHWVERYGLDEVRKWSFEVWDEPNLTRLAAASRAIAYRCIATPWRRSRTSTTSSRSAVRRPLSTHGG